MQHGKNLHQLLPANINPETRPCTLTTSIPYRVPSCHTQPEIMPHLQLPAPLLCSDTFSMASLKAIYNMYFIRFPPETRLLRLCESHQQASEHVQYIQSSRFRARCCRVIRSPAVTPPPCRRRATESHFAGD